MQVLLKVIKVIYKFCYSATEIVPIRSHLYVAHVDFIFCGN